MLRRRHKRPILRAQLQQQWAHQIGTYVKISGLDTPPEQSSQGFGYVHGDIIQRNPARRVVRSDLALAASAGGVPGQICWWTGAPGYQKCCSYPGMSLPVCTDYKDVE